MCISDTVRLKCVLLLFLLYIMYIIMYRFVVVTIVRSCCISTFLILIVLKMDVLVTGNLISALKKKPSSRTQEVRDVSRFMLLRFGKACLWI